MSATEDTPMACTLETGAMGERLAEIENLTRQHLRSHRVNDLALHLTYDSEAASEVRRLVDLERACCAFLDFDLQVQPDGVELTIKAPQGAADSARWLFAQFLPDEPAKDRRSQPNCACCRS